MQELMAMIANVSKYEYDSDNANRNKTYVQSLQNDRSKDAITFFWRNNDETHLVPVSNTSRAHF